MGGRCDAQNEPARAVFHRFWEDSNRVQIPFGTPRLNSERPGGYTAAVFVWLPAPTTLRIAYLLWLGCFAETIRGTAAAEILIYEGRLHIEGRPFQGVGRFKFALIDAAGVPVWSSQPMNLHVNDGAYAVRLGDSAQAPAIADRWMPGTALPKLRIWFERSKHGCRSRGTDVALKPERAAEGSDSGSQMAAVLTELREIRALIEGKTTAAPTPAAETVTVSNDGAPATGSAEASLVLVEFTEFQCPQSISFEKTRVALKTNYVDAGKLRILTRNVLQPFHPLAVPAARAALCADHQGRFLRSGNCPMQPRR